MEKIIPSALIVSTYVNTIRSKTIELQREIYEKMNVTKYPKIGFGTNMPAMDFQNLLWVMNDCNPKEIIPELAQQVKDNSKGAVNAEIILFLNWNVIPLSNDSISCLIDLASEGKIVNFSLYDGIALSKDLYKRIGEPNMRDLFHSARKNKVPIETLTVSSIVEGSKTYSLNGKDLFWQSGGEMQEQKFWNKCDDILVRGIYEDRSIKH